jgi:hypothetical protein
MPELSELSPWNSVSWDNMTSGCGSGTGNLDKRPYYFRVIGSGGTTKILLISAVPSRTQTGAMHATDYLRLNHQAFMRLMELGAQAFAESTAGH